MRKYIAISLCFILTIFAFTPVYAEDSSAINEYKGSEIPDELKEELIKNGSIINSETIIEFVELSQSQTGNALVVTNKISDFRIIKDVYVSLGENGKPVSLTIKNAGKRFSSGTYYSYNAGKALIKASASYNVYSNGSFEYFQPYSAAFYYSKTQACNVSKIKVEYHCDGIPFTYPGFKNISYNEEDYIITVSRSYPQENTIFRTTNPIASNRCLRISEGLFAGQWLTFVYTIDGVEDGYSLKI